MASVYDRTDIYDLFDSPKKDAQTLSHWQTVFDGRPIRSALDVSIGTGSLTLPLGQLGVSLYGSDLSGSMLARCRKKADERGIAIDLRQSDFRDLTSHFDRSFDCVMSTGNSLAYVTNNEITGVLEQMDALVEPGGCRMSFKPSSAAIFFSCFSLTASSLQLFPVSPTDRSQ